MQENYIVLSRKYRPSILGELIGQDVLTQTLKNAFTSGKIAHAFILTGVRGIGKTTTARIIAKSLNCTNLKDGIEPCNECESCKSILQDSSLDVVEMDAASNTGVDDVRTIIDSVQYKPVNSKYKVFIIDEVHMLSNSAFNALLKTLEEPPAHIKFIFATTEIKKVPVTVLSRCQRFDLPRVESATLAKHLTNICQKEGVNCEEKAINLIAQAAQGSVRDGLSLLDQAIVLCNNNIDLNTTINMLGKGYLLSYYQLIDLIFKGNHEKALNAVEELYNQGNNPVTIVERMLDIINRLLKIKSVESYLSSNQANEEDLSIGKEIASNVSIASLLKIWQVLLQGFEEVKISSMPKSSLDVLTIKATWVYKMPNIDELINHISQQESVTKQEQAPTAEPVKQTSPQESTTQNTSKEDEIDQKIKTAFRDAVKV